MKKITIFTILIFFNWCIYSQEEIKLINISEIDSTSIDPYILSGEKIKCLNDGNCIIIKDSTSFKYTSSKVPYSRKSYLLQKIDSIGKIIWSFPLLYTKIHDLRIKDNYIYLAGEIYKSDGTSTIWLGKYDFLGQKIWTNEYKINYKSSAHRMVFTKNGGAYILGKISKRKRKLKIRLNNGIRNWMKMYRPKVEKIVLMEIDKDGKKKWHKLFGEWKDQGQYYFPTSIALNNKDEICFTSSIYIRTSGCSDCIYDTWIVKLNSKKEILKSQFLKSIYFEKVIPFSQNSFYLIGKNSSHEHFKRDSLFIYKLDDKNNLTPTYNFESQFDIVFIKAVEYDNPTHTFFIGGWAFENMIKEEGWKNNLDRNNWIASFSMDNEKFNEWVTSSPTRDGINDLEVTDRYIFTIGCNWSSELNKFIKKIKTISFMKIKR